MPDTLTAQDVAARADALRQRAERLARDGDSPHRQGKARGALHDIAEAEKWLQQPDAARRPHILAFAQAELDMAEHLLGIMDDMASEAVR